MISAGARLYFSQESILLVTLPDSTSDDPSQQWQEAFTNVGFELISGSTKSIYKD
jgi:hypothetical protein